jgi:hypothetical protein
VKIIYFFDESNKKIRTNALLDGAKIHNIYEWEIGTEEVLNVSEAVRKGVKFFPNGLRDTIHKILLSGI